jgi:hypothetical protein
VTDAYIRGLDTGGDGHARTNWALYCLDDIWNMVRTEDSRVTYTQIEGWRNLASLCDEQASQLEAATKQLVQRWPALPGSASEAFSTHITTLITSMRQAAQAGAANQQPLVNITSALTYARVEIEGLLETRKQYLAAERQSPIPSPNPSPGQNPSGPATPPSNWRTQLDQQARTIMAHADSTVGTEASNIQAPWELRSAGTNLNPSEGRHASVVFDELQRPVRFVPRVGGAVPACRCGAPGLLAPGAVVCSPPSVVGMVGGVQASAGSAHRRCQQVTKASRQGQVWLMRSQRRRAWWVSRAGRCHRR